MASKQSKLRVKHEEDEDGSPFTEEPQRQRSDDQAYVKKSKSRSSPEKVITYISNSIIKMDSY